jgi:hypothetical protein
MQFQPTNSAPGERIGKVFFPLLLSALLTIAGCGGGSTPSTGTLNNGFTNFDPADLSSSLAAYLAFDVGGIDGAGSSSGGSGADGGAGDGGAMRRAAVVLSCSNSAAQYSGTTDDTGKYLIRFDRTACQSPYLLRVVDVGGNIYSSIGVDTPAEGKVVRINITPLTDKVVSDVVQPLGLGATSQNFTAQSLTSVLTGAPLITAVNTAKDNLRASISDALAASGITSVSTFDPVVSTHAFNGTGVDAVLESISHTRAPQTGRTVLSAKLVSIGSGATPTIAEITAATPLTVAQINAPTSPTLNYSKLDAWIAQLNFCAASVPGSITTAICDTNVISNTYKHSSMDFEEHFKSLLSNGSCGTNPGPCHIQGSTFRNPVLLFTGKYAGSAASYDDLAVVEVTINQPSVGNYYSASVATPVEYTKILVFKRDDAATGLTAGNWVLHGNQRNFDFSVTPRYEKFTQINSARDGNTAPTPTITVTFNISGNPIITTSAPGFTYTNVIGTQTATLSTINLNDPSIYGSGMRIFVNPFKFNKITRLWDPANIQAVKVTGPGLPSAGLVMMSNATSVCGGDDFLSIANATGSMPTGTGTVFNSAGLTGNSYSLARVLQNDLTQEPWFQSLPSAVRRTGGNLTDFSGLTAYGQYQFDVRLTDGTQTTEFARTLAAVNPPALLASAHWHDMSPSAALLSPVALTSTATDYAVSWVNNPLAAYVNSVQIFTSVFTRNGVGNIITPAWSHSRGVAAASALVRPTAQNLGYPVDPACLGGGQYPAISAIRDQRQFTIRSYQGRADMYNILAYRK